MNLLLSLRSEILKTKRTATFYFTLIAAALVPFIFLLDACFDGISTDNRKDPLNAVVREGFGVVSVLILPMFIILACTLLPQIEYRNNTWKQVFTSPQKMINIFMARFLNVQLLILLFFACYNLFIAIAIVVIHFVDPSLDLLHQPFNWNIFLTYNVNSYLAILGMSTIQFWIGLRFRNFILPIAIGISLWFAATLMVFELHTKNAEVFPYTYLLFSSFPKYKSMLTTIQLSSVAYMVVFLGIGFLDFRRRRGR